MIVWKCDENHSNQLRCTDNKFLKHEKLKVITHIDCTDFFLTCKCRGSQFLFENSTSYCQSRTTPKVIKHQ